MSPSDRHEKANFQSLRSFFERPPDLDHSFFLLRIDQNHRFEPSHWESSQRLCGIKEVRPQSSEIHINLWSEGLVYIHIHLPLLMRQVSSSFFYCISFFVWRLIRRRQVPTSLIWVAPLRAFGGYVLSLLGCIVILQFLSEDRSTPYGIFEVLSLRTYLRFFLLSLFFFFQIK